MALPKNKEELATRLTELQWQWWDSDKLQWYANQWSSLKKSQWIDLTTGEKPKWFLERTWERLSERWGEIIKTVSEIPQWRISPVESWIRVLWDVAWWVNDLIGEAVVSWFRAAWEPWKKTVQDFVKTDIWQSALEALQWWVESYNKFKNSSEWIRRAVESFEGVVNIWELLLFKWWATATKKVAKEAAEDIWKAAAKKAWALERWAVESVRETAEEIALPTLKELWKRQRAWAAKEVVETWWIWPLKKESLVRSPKEIVAIEETARLINEWKLAQSMSEVKKLSAIWEEIEWLAWALSARLKGSWVQFTRSELDDLFTWIKTELVDSPIIVWDAEASFKKLNAQIEKLIPKKDVMDADEILQLRKDIDSTVKRFKGEWVFDPKNENAFTETLRAYRQWINDTLEAKAPEADVKNLLQRQSALFQVEKTIWERFSARATTIPWKILQAFEQKTWLPRTEIIEAWTAIWLSWFAPWLATVAWWLLGVSLTNRLLKSSILRTRLAELLRKVAKKDITPEQGKADLWDLVDKLWKWKVAWTAAGVAIIESMEEEAKEADTFEEFVNNAQDELREMFEQAKQD